MCHWLQYVRLDYLSLVAVCVSGLCVIGCSMCAWTMCHWFQYVRLDYVSFVAVCAPGLCVIGCSMYAWIHVTCSVINLTFIFFRKWKNIDLHIFECLFLGGQIWFLLVAVCAPGLCVIGCRMCTWTMCHWLQYVRLDYLSLVALCTPVFILHAQLEIIFVHVCICFFFRKWKNIENI